MLKFPFDITDVPDEINQTLLKYFKGSLNMIKSSYKIEILSPIPGERDGFVQVGPSKYFFPKQFREKAGSYYNFQARSSDVWVSTFPRSGTTWTQELVWLIGNNLDFGRANTDYLTSRFPFFE